MKDRGNFIGNVHYASRAKRMVANMITLSECGRLPGPGQWSEGRFAHLQGKLPVPATKPSSTNLMQCFVVDLKMGSCFSRKRKKSTIRSTAFWTVSFDA